MQFVGGIALAAGPCRETPAASAVPLTEKKRRRLERRAVHGEASLPNGVMSPDIVFRSVNTTILRMIA